MAQETAAGSRLKAIEGSVLGINTIFDWRCGVDASC
jgi:hypothetical protein